MARTLVRSYELQRTSDKGYALPLVLIGIAILLVFAGEVSSRVSREARVTKVRENSEMAFYAAEAGFNRVRARLIKKANDIQMMELDDDRGQLFYDDNGTQRLAGEYEIQIVSLDPEIEYRVTVTGTYGQDTYQTKRIVAGTIRVTGTKSNGDNRVATTYTP